MSSSLSVKLKDSLINLDLLICDANKILRDLLMVSDCPLMVAFSVKNGTKERVKMELVGRSQESFLIGLDNSNDAVAISFIEIEKQQGISDEEAGVWCMIDVGTTKAPIEFAMAASIAVAFSKVTQSLIFDDGSIWTESLDIWPEQFINLIKVKNSSEDIHQAAQKMFSKLNCSLARRYTK